MHELPVTERILAIVLKHAAAHSAGRVLSVTLETGELSGLEPVWIQRYFSRLAKGTIAENAAIVVQRVAVTGKCTACGTEYPLSVIKLKRAECPACGDRSVKIVSGDEFRVKEMEVR